MDKAKVARFGLYLAGFMAIVNISVIYLALPPIERALHAGLADQEWILSIYPLMEGGFTLAAGTLGDLYGRKRVLSVSSWIFILATIGCALAPSAPVLIVLRGLQGLGGAALLSLPVAILVQMATDERGSEDAIKGFSTTAGLGAVAGPVIGGVLVHSFGWPSVFWLSAIMGVVALTTYYAIPESDRDASMKLDGGGQLLSILAFLAISYGLIEGNAVGWASPVIVGAFLVFIAAMALFIALERRVAQPMIHLRYFMSRRFNAGMLLIGILNFGWYGIMLLCTLFLQNVLHQTAMAAGFYMMPNNIAFFVFNQVSSTVERAIGLRALIALSFIVSLGGIAWLAALNSHSAAWEVSGGLFVAGIGWGLIFTPAANMCMGAVAKADEGFASGATALSRSLFGVFGIAILGSLLAAGMAKFIGNGLAAAKAPAAAAAQVVAAVHHGGAFSIAANPPAGISQSDLMALTQHGFVSGLHVALAICLAVTVIVGLLIYGVLPTRSSEVRSQLPESAAAS